MHTSRYARARARARICTFLALAAAHSPAPPHAAPSSRHDIVPSWRAAAGPDSVRAPEWRYTEWLRFDGTLLHGDFAHVVGRELYDHRGDDGGKHSGGSRRLWALALVSGDGFLTRPDLIDR